MNPSLQNYFRRIHAAYQADPERVVEIRKLSEYVRAKLGADQTARLIFVCTHNSRRSHMAEALARAAADYFDLDGIETFSGGTEATAFHPNAVGALKEAGFEIQVQDSSKNPVYLVKLGGEDLPVRHFSKRFSDEHNPASDFAAVMTCSDADEACPVVPGADLRIRLRYEDPKRFDGTNEELGMYAARRDEIAGEMLHLMEEVRHPATV